MFHVLIYEKLSGESPIIRFFFMFFVLLTVRSYDDDSMLLPRGLAVFQQFVLIVGIGIGTMVERLLVEQLSFEQVTHLRGACLVVVTVQAKVLFGLLNASLGNLELLA